MANRENKDNLFAILQDIKQELIGIALILLGGFLMIPAVFSESSIWWIGVIVLLFFGFLVVWLYSSAGNSKK